MISLRGTSYHTYLRNKMNARSRLQQRNSETQPSESATAPSRRTTRKNNSALPTHKFIKHLPLLLLSIACFFWLMQVATTVYPSDIAHWLIPNTYLPMLAPLFFTTWFLFSYLLLNLQQGLVFALAVTLLVFFRLQMIVFSLSWLLIFFIFTAVAFFLTKKPQSAKYSS